MALWVTWGRTVDDVSHPVRTLPHMDENTTHATQQPLPFGPDDDLPVELALTARARRTVAPDALPALRVVGRRPAPVARPVPPAHGTAVDPGPGSDVDAEGEDDRSDTRPARARALRRAGVDLAAIAGQLAVDELLVRAWVGGVAAPSRRARRPSAPPLHAGGTDVEGERRRTAFELARADARREATARLAADPRLAAGLGLLAGTVEVDADAVTLTTGDARVAGVVLRWLRDVLGADPAAVRVVLRVGPDAAGDLVRHRWAKALDLPGERIRTTRWAGAPRPGEVEGLVRVVDGDVAAATAGWRDALLSRDVEDDLATPGPAAGPGRG